MGEPPSGQLPLAGVQIAAADPPLDETPPSLAKVREAVRKLKGGKAAGVCNISAEMLKAGGEAMIHGLHAVLTAVWQTGTIPPDWKRGLVVPIWKGKGDRQDCNNYRGITLLSVPGKVLAHLLMTRVRAHLLKFQRPEQSGFTPGKSTTDQILALRVLVERRLQFRQGLLAAYVDLKKAFDSVHRETLWELLRVRGIPARIIDLITGLYSGTESAVKCGGGTSSFFPVNSGVRQGCVLAPSLFNTCMDWVLGKVADQSHCGASVGNTMVTDLVFADDAVILAESLEVLVMALEVLHEEAKPLGLKVSWPKTKVQVFGGLLDDTVQSVHACGEDVEICESFTYLGSVVHNDGGCGHEVIRRIGLAHGIMDSLDRSIWRCRYLCRRTKIRIFKSLVLPVLLYGCETWTLNADLKRRLDVCGTKCLRRVMGYRWYDYVSNQRLLRETESRPVTSIVLERQLRLYGHVARFPEVDPAYRVASVRDNPEWRRPRGRPRNSWLEQVDRSCWKLFGMGRVTARGLARRNRREWSRRVSEAKLARGCSCSHPPSTGQQQQKPSTAV